MVKNLEQIRQAQRANAKSYYNRKKNDPAYKAKRKAAWQKWYQEQKSLKKKE